MEFAALNQLNQPVNLDHIQTVSASTLSRYIGSLDERMMAEVCLALMIATGCDSAI